MSIINWLRGSLFRQFATAFGMVTLLVIAVIVPALWLTELSSGSGGAINVSGSLRMQSYKLALAVADPFESHEERERRTQDAVKDFSKRLTSAELTNGITQSKEAPLYQQYQELRQQYENTVAPMALASINDIESRRIFVKRIPDFVRQVDSFVAALEQGLNSRISLLKILLTSVLFGALLLTVLMLRYLKKSIFTPLEMMGKTANLVREGHLSERSQIEGPNEIGQLGLTFDFMIVELEKLYGSLEAQVAAQTADLNRRAQGLQFLNTVGHTLSAETTIDEKVLEDCLNEFCRMMGAYGCSLWLDLEGEASKVSRGEAMRYQIAATKDYPAHDEMLPDNACVKCFALQQTQEVLGELRIIFTYDTIEPWQENLAGALAHTIGRSIVLAKRQLEDRRLAVLEERNTIARELHDSIAQSLSFSRIQLLRLKRAMQESEPNAQKLDDIVKELSTGITTAYRQLREVLTAFRLQLNRAGFVGAVQEVIDEFKNRTGIAVNLHSTLIGLELSANEQVHLVQILREAMVNIEKHARATQVEIILAHQPEGIELIVRDNGIGISPAAAQKRDHFGLSIMKERAHAIGGSISIVPLDQGGTQVCLKVSKKS